MGTEEFLVAVLAPVLGADVAVGDVAQLTSGASRRSWRFEVAGSGRRYVLQVEMGPRSTDRPGALAAEAQARLMTAAGAAGVPVPPVLAAGIHEAVHYLVTGWVEGEALPPVLLRDRSAGLRALQPGCARALASIHALQADGLGLEPEDRLASYRERLDAISWTGSAGEPRPVLEWAWRWLEDNRPQPGPAVVVHGDFRLGNLLVDRTGLAAVLDWELAHLGDRHEDVAWAMIRAWRFDRHRPPGVFPDPDTWAAHYEAQAGTGTIDLDVLRWWLVAGTWSWAVICAMQARRHLDGWVRSPEHALIGRRVCESEWDLLELLK